LRRLVDCPSADVPGGTVGEALAAVFARSPTLRGYIVDDQGALRRHVVVFVAGEAVRDRLRLSDAVAPDDPVIQDPHRIVRCANAPEVFWAQHHNGIFRSGDGARSWTEVKAKPSS